jgi:hypothetical protein
MNIQKSLDLVKKQSSWMPYLALSAALIFALIGCRASGGQPTVAPINPPVQQPSPLPPTDTVQPTTVPAVPTATVAQPTTAPTATNAVQPTATQTVAVDTNAEGDQVLQLLNQLDQMNQKGDAFNDLPQP